jgi:hypothetical protein
MCAQDGIGVEEQAYLVEHMPQIDEDEMLHLIPRFPRESDTE